jgi:hypothetical protein
MSLWKRIKQAINNYLERVSAENKEMFGSGRLDCCNLNSQSRNKKQL